MLSGCASAVYAGDGGGKRDDMVFCKGVSGSILCSTCISYLDCWRSGKEGIKRGLEKSVFCGTALHAVEEMKERSNHHEDAENNGIQVVPFVLPFSYLLIDRYRKILGFPFNHHSVIRSFFCWKSFLGGGEGISNRLLKK